MDRFLDVYTEEQLDLISKQLLFRGLSRDELTAFLRYADPMLLHIPQGEVIHSDHPAAEKIGLVFSGMVRVYHIDYEGILTVVRVLQPGDTIGTIFSLMGNNNKVYDAEAVKDTDALIMEPETLLETYPPLAAVQHRILRNLLDSQAHLYYILSRRLDILSQRSLRDKILRLLHYARDIFGADEFDVPYSRDEMASYLAVDRASLSRSLGALRKEGVIEFQKNHFVLLQPELTEPETE